MKAISRDELVDRLRTHEDLTLVEVLGEEAYNTFHLPRAINVPLGDGFDERIQEAVPDKSATVVVYCKNTECRASPKAARRMDELGYRDVLDYEAGKEDWKAAGLPTEP